MQVALIDDVPTVAEPSAPQTATCPGCGGLVELRRREEKYFWRHRRVPAGGCSARRGQPATDADRTLAAIARKCGGTAFTLRAGETRTLTGPGIVILLEPRGETI